MQAPTRPTIDLKTRCACGQVGITVSGAVRAMLLCSCRDCQRATGTGHSAVVMFATSDVTMSGAIKSHAQTADSGAIFTRSFCPQCGTPLAGASSRAPGTMLLPIGLFGDETDWFVPNQLIFARSHNHWDVVPADLPQYARYRDSGAA